MDAQKALERAITSAASGTAGYVLLNLYKHTPLAFEHYYVTAMATGVLSYLMFRYIPIKNWRARNESDTTS